MLKQDRGGGAAFAYSCHGLLYPYRGDEAFVEQVLDELRVGTARAPPSHGSSSVYWALMPKNTRAGDLNPSKRVGLDTMTVDMGIGKGGLGGQL